MSERYLFRAALEFDWHVESGDGTALIVTPGRLPMRLEPFWLDRSPNFELYLANLGWIDTPNAEKLSQNPEYPLSLLYVETEVQPLRDRAPEEAADDLFEELQGILRLFQGGDVFVRRRPEHAWHIQENGTREAFVPGLKPGRLESPTPYRRGCYRLDDRALENLASFFGPFWDLLQDRRQPMSDAFFHFSLSYERSNLVERLAELITAMEILFADSECTQHGIANRCACLLYPPGTRRDKALAELRQFYGNAVVRDGEPVRLLRNTDDAERFEEYVRRSVLRLLELHKQGYRIVTGSQLDDLVARYYGTTRID